MIEDQDRIDEHERRVGQAEPLAWRFAHTRLERAHRFVRQVADRAADEPRQGRARRTSADGIVRSTSRCSGSERIMYGSDRSRRPSSVGLHQSHTQQRDRIAPDERVPGQCARLLRCFRGETPARRRAFWRNAETGVSRSAIVSRKIGTVRASSDASAAIWRICSMVGVRFQRRPAGDATGGCTRGPWPARSFPS